MKYSTLLIMGLASIALAKEDPGPSPTASVGCEPHGDHWHCDGPAETPTSTSTEEGEHSNVTPAVPSPSESAGCEPHGDHWHCDGPASTEAAATSSASDDATSSASPTVPSPSQSVGCEPHGDHWHCDGPAETSSAAASATGSAGEEGGAGAIGVSLSAVAAMAVGVAFVYA